MSSIPAPDQAEDVLGDAGVSQRVVRGGGMRIVGFGLVNLMGALGSIVLLRHLGVVDYGRYGTVIALMAIAGGLSDAGLTITGSRELALRAPGSERRELLGSILGLRITMSVAFVLIGLAIGVAAGYDGEMLLGVVLVGGGAVLVAIQVTVLLPLVVNLRNGRLTVSEIVKQAILLVGIVALAVAHGGVVAFFALQVAVGIGAVLLIPILGDRADLAGPRWGIAEWRDIARTTLPIAGALVLTVVYVRLLVVMTSVLSDDVETGLFVTSARVVEMLGGLALVIASVVLPVAAVAARDDRGRLAYVLTKTTETSVLLGALIAIVLVLAARPVTILLGGGAFAEAAPVVRTQAPAIVTIFLVQSWIAFLIADHRQRDLGRCVAIGLVALVVSGGVLIGPHGAQGAALAAVLSDVIYATAVFVAVRRLPGRPSPLGLSYLLRLVVVSAAALGAGWASDLPDALAATLAAIVFALLAAVLRMVPADLYAAIPRPGTRRRR